MVKAKTHKAEKPIDLPFAMALDSSEVWKPVHGHTGYEASSFGRIRSIDREIPYKRSFRRHKGRIIQSSLAGKRRQYLYVSVAFGQKIGVHRLVAKAFHGPPPSAKHEAAHWNGHPVDNWPDNIRWALQIENNHDMDRHGTRWTGVRPRGEDHGRAKLSCDDVKAIRARLTGKRGELTEIAILYKMDLSTISDIKNGKTWTHI